MCVCIACIVCMYVCYVMCMYVCVYLYVCRHACICECVFVVCVYAYYIHMHACTLYISVLYGVVPCRQVGSLDVTDGVLLKEAMGLKDGINLKCDQLAVDFPLCLSFSSWSRSLPKHLRHLLYTIMGIPSHHIASS
jgi:hypothetical protein